MTRTEAHLRFALFATAVLSALPASAGELPSGPSVVLGGVDVSTPAASAMTIRQSSPNAIVNWRGFSIGDGARVDIEQPSTASAILNRVTGSTPSTIAGQLNANGQVYLLNPNGILIQKSGTVRTGAFVASTLAMTDEDFAAGKRDLLGNGRSATVVNQGSIEVGPGGYAALVGGRVENSGSITARMGKIGLGAGEKATLDLSGDGFLQVAVPSEQAHDDDGALISNSGRLVAHGGRVELQAATARQMARQVINLAGIVQARTVSGVSGAITLGGGEGGRVRVSGRLDASAAPVPAAELASVTPPPPRPERGGSIVVTGAAIELAGATLDASGPAGGGSIRVGGEYRGGGGLPRALTTSVDAASLIRADALDVGDGGSVIVWSDEHTKYEGTIRARGGKGGGDGGFAEVSGKDRLWYAGSADLSAASGTVGTLLLDPSDISIVEDPDPESNEIAAGTIEADLSGADVVLSTASDDDEAGNIAVEAPMSWETGSTLTLQADNAISIAQPITAEAGGLTLIAFDGDITTGPLGAIDVGTFELTGSWVQNAPTLPGFSATDFRSFSGTFLRAVGGDGSTDAPYVVTDVYGLQGLNGMELAHFALRNDIDASGTDQWNLVGDGPALGFDPIGNPDALFEGSLDGRGFSVNGLYIDQPELDSTVGLFQFLGDAGAIRNINLTNVDITGGFSGALVGDSSGTVSNAVVMTGSVAGRFVVGGLVGENDGVVSRSRMLLGNVTGLSPDQTVDFVVGGLVGQNFGAVTQSFSTATVTGLTLEGSTAPIGGLVGLNTGTGTVSDSFASGAVASAGPGEPLLGGLVGQNDGEARVIRTYATGSVTATGAADGLAGGLVGQNAGLVDQSYAAGPVSGNAPVGLGGLVGGPPDETAPPPVFASFWDSTTTGQPASAGGGTPLTTGAFQNTATFMAQAEAAGWSFTDTWAPPNPGHYPELYSVSPVIWADIGDASVVYGFPASFRPPVTQSGGPGQFVLGPAGDTPPIVPLVSPGLPSGGVGTYTVTAAPTATSALGVPYRVVATDGTLTVTPAPLTITADDQVKRYGRLLSFLGSEFTPAGLVNGDNVTSVDLTSLGEARDANVGEGPFAISVANAVGSGLINGEGVANYAITYVPGTLTVTPAPLVIRGDDRSKPFAQSLAFAGTEFTTEGLVNGDRVTSAVLRSDGAPGTAVPSRYPIEISDARGSGLAFDGVGNYDISYVAGELLVLPPSEPDFIPQRFDAGLRLVYYDGLPNPSDVIEIAGTEGFEAASGGGGGPTLGTARPVAATAARETLSFLESLSTRLEARVASCTPVPPSADPLLACVRDALADYARELDARILDLPEPLRAVSAVIRQSAQHIEGVRADAARRIAAATTDEEIRAIEREAAARAGAVVETAVAEIRKAIELIRAEDDPQLASLQAEQGAAITTALQNVEAELAQAVGL